MYLEYCAGKLPASVPENRNVQRIPSAVIVYANAPELLIFTYAIVCPPGVWMDTPLVVMTGTLVVIVLNSVVGIEAVVGSGIGGGGGTG
jgi:hypothetical protein